MKYVLVYCYDNSIYHKLTTDSFDEAHAEMRKLFLEESQKQGADERYPEQMEEIKNNGEFIDFDIGLSETEAYLLFNEPIVWKIIEVE